MSLCLSPNSAIVDYEDVMLVPTPKATKTWTPLPHYEFIDTTIGAIEGCGFQIKEFTHALWKDGIRYFGVATLQMPDANWAAMIALRHAHDQAFAPWWGFGTRVFCCDNLQVSAELFVNRKQTVNVRVDLERLNTEAIWKIQSRIDSERTRVDQYQKFVMTQPLVDHFIMECYRYGVIPSQTIDKVWQEWVESKKFPDRNAWSLYNAFTQILKGRVLTYPHLTQRLNTVFDNNCTLLG